MRSTSVSSKGCFSTKLVLLTGMCLAVLAFPVVVRADSIVSWGYDGDGQVSDTPTGSNFTAIAAVGDHSLALKDDGSIVSWGYDGAGQVSDTPTGSNFTAIAAGAGHSLALKENGAIVSWGNDNYGQVSKTPIGSDFIDMVGGAYHSLALKEDGSIVSWGRDNHGQVSHTPSASNFTDIAAGRYHSLALSKDGFLVSWGYDSAGQVSDTPAGSDFTDIAGSRYHGLALKEDGSIVSWGCDWDGRVSDTPTGSNFVDIADGWGHSLALKEDGSIVSWGDDDAGQVSNTPTGSNFTDIAGGSNHSLALTTEPPVADADGPYSIYVGDTLTLDASGSTDADDDIASYTWDLDGDETFETDAGDQPILVLDYSYLQSLGLLIKHTYTIHLKVTDSQGQSDTADSTLTIVPKPATVVAVDIKPGSCPNPVNVKSKGVLPVAILGTDDYDITTIDPTSIRLIGIEPLRSGYEDVATPVSDANDCNCTEEGPDGFLDLTLKFKTQRIVEAIGDVNDGDVLVLELTGVLYDPPPYETPIEGADCVLIRGRHKPINPADINKDGVVNTADFAIFAQNWLQSSIVDE